MNYVFTCHYTGVDLTDSFVESVQRIVAYQNVALSFNAIH